MSTREQEAQHALIDASNAVAVADEKCIAAEYGSEVLAAIEEARKALAYVLALIEGRV